MNTPNRRAAALACLAAMLAQPSLAQPTHNPGGIPAYDALSDTIRGATVFQASVTPFLNMTTATTTRVVTASTGKTTYITHVRFHAAGTTTAKLVTGTGANCGTGTADLTETLDLVAADGMVYGDGSGPVVIAAAGLDVCVVNGQAINLRVGLAAAQF